MDEHLFPPREKAMACLVDWEDEGALAEAKELLEGIILPKGYSLRVYGVEAKGRAAAYNRILREDGARYKLYISATVKRIHGGLLPYLLQFFEANPRCGIMGLIGSELPLDGNPACGKRIFGRYDCEQGGQGSFWGENPLFCQRVHHLGSGFLVTSHDMLWDESMAEEFLAASQCCRFRRQGLDALVPMQNQAWVCYREDRCIFRRQEELETGEGRERFLAAYRDMVQPKVSVLIPAYNQPEFFRAALESALAQEYGNIEILVGDDSTDDRVRKVIEPYLERYPHITYYPHGGSLGGYGKGNMDFLLAKSTGEFINYLLHDDLLYPAKIRRMMEVFVRDMEEEVGFVTSERYAIDREGRIMRKRNPWHPWQDKVIPGRTFGRKILFTMTNFIGETTTMLFRKAPLLAEDGTGRYFAGHYCGIEDLSMWDTSTGLELCKRGKSCVFLAEPLSAVRKHPEQNTWNMDVLVTDLLDWLDYIVLSWLNDFYLESEAEFQACCLHWRQGHRESFRRIREQELTEVGRKRQEALRRMILAIDGGDYGSLVHLDVEYMLSFTENQEKLLAACRKNARGQWEKRGY